MRLLVLLPIVSNLARTMMTGYAAGTSAGPRIGPSSGREHRRCWNTNSEITEDDLGQDEQAA
jgi:hypothetical protein